jgi:hypothetical protein
MSAVSTKKIGKREAKARALLLAAQYLLADSEETVSALTESDNISEESASLVREQLMLIADKLTNQGKDLAYKLGIDWQSLV